MGNVRFRELMYGYAAETVTAKRIKVYMPDLFPDQKKGAAIDFAVNIGSAKNTIINVNPPPISNSIMCRNYLYLPVAQKDPLSVKLHDRLLLGFVNCDPKNGIIIGKA